MKIFLILSEVQSGWSSGGGVVGFDRAKMLGSLGAMSVAFVDWDDVGALELSEGIYCNPISRVNMGRVGRWVWRNYFDRFGSEPWFRSLFSKRQIQRQLSQYVSAARPDIFCFDNIPSTIAWDACAAYPRIYFAHNVEADIVQYMSSRGSLERQRMVEYERRIVREADGVVCFTQKDAESLRRIAPEQTFHVIPPAFDAPAEQAKNICLPDEGKRDYVILPTNATWQPNVLSLRWFFEEVFPKIESDVPFIMTGRDGDGFLKSLADQFDNLEYRGLVPRAEYESLLGNATLFVNPTKFGSGFQIKLMEAVRGGVPIISTAYSNHLGSAVTATDDPLEMAELISNWLKYKSGVARPDYSILHQAAKDGTIAALRSAVQIWENKNKR